MDTSDSQENGSKSYNEFAIIWKVSDIIGLISLVGSAVSFFSKIPLWGSITIEVILLFLLAHRIRIVKINSSRNWIILIALGIGILLCGVGIAKSAKSSASYGVTPSNNPKNVATQTSDKPHGFPPQDRILFDAHLLEMAYGTGNLRIQEPSGGKLIAKVQSLHNGTSLHKSNYELQINREPKSELSYGVMIIFTSEEMHSWADYGDGEIEIEFQSGRTGQTLGFRAEYDSDKDPLWQSTILPFHGKHYEGSEICHIPVQEILEGNPKQKVSQITVTEGLRNEPGMELNFKLFKITLRAKRQVPEGD